MSTRDNKTFYSPLFLKYQGEFEKNPRSRVFAPLAEMYRKLGMHDKAMEILSQGIRFHPTYVMGYLGLAFCYYDLKEMALAYTTLRPHVENNRDNLRLQNLFADICLDINYKEEALDTLKYLLFLNPRDKLIAERVQKLEHEIESNYRPVHRPIYIPEEELITFNNSEKISTLNNASHDDFDSWRAVDLSENKKGTKVIGVVTEQVGWVLKKPDVHLNFQDDNFLDNAQTETQKDMLEKQIEEVDFIETNIPTFRVKEQPPIVTHTLVDLYIGQGHLSKAIEVLERILVLNPDDQKTIKKLQEVKDIVDSEGDDIEFVVSSVREDQQIVDDESREYVDEGRKNLMDVFDQKVNNLAKTFNFSTEIDNCFNDTEEEIINIQNIKKERIKDVESKLNIFLEEIQKKAKAYRLRT